MRPRGPAPRIGEHTRAILSGAGYSDGDIERLLAAGVVVMAGTVVNVGCSVGAGCLLNTRSSIDHDSVMHDFSSLAPGATLGGTVTVGERASIGLGASLSNRVSIGNDTIIGLGSAVTGDIPALVVAYGSPARSVRPRRIDEPYL